MANLMSKLRIRHFEDLPQPGDIVFDYSKGWRAVIRDYVLDNDGNVIPDLLYVNYAETGLWNDYEVTFVKDLVIIFRG